MSAFLAADHRFLGLDDRQADPDESGIIVLPVPFERTSSFGTGSAAGPEAILRASREVELYDTELGFEPWAAAGGIATLRPLALESDDDGETVAESVDRVVSCWRERRKMVVTIAGEHTGVVGAVRAHVRSSAEVTVLQLDAHSDLRDSYLGDRWNHACTMARVLDFHGDIVQVGVRSESPEERGLAESRGVRVFRASKILDEAEQGRDWVAAVLETCAEQVYVTLDCDVLDPAVLPATGTPEPGGLSWRQINAFLDRLSRARRVIGFDVSELAPVKGLHHPQFTVAKLIARFAGWMGGRQPAVPGAKHPGRRRRPVTTDDDGVRSKTNHTSRGKRTTLDLRIGETSVGRGVFVTRPYAAGEEILVFTGEEIDFETTLVKGERECDALQIGPNRYLDLDAPGVFINHSCDPNAGIRDDVRLVALRDLRPAEEITYDYSTTMNEDHWEMPCRCGSPKCRGVVRDFKWLPMELKLELMSCRVVQRFLIDAEFESGRLTLRHDLRSPRSPRGGP